MLSCNLYNNYFFNWSAFWSTVQKLTIALTHKRFGGAGRPNSALHLKPFCTACVWSALALGTAGSLTFGVWKYVHKRGMPCNVYFSNMTWKWYDRWLISFFFFFFNFFFFIPFWQKVSLELETCLCWKNYSTLTKKKRWQKVIHCDA